MSFEASVTRVIQDINPIKGSPYIEPMNDIMDNAVID